MNDYLLLKDLPNCPNGAILKLTPDEECYYTTGINKETGENNQLYVFPRVDVRNNPHWFEEIIEK